MILLIDNYDSFVFTVARYLAELDEVPRVIRNDAIDVSGILELGPAAIVLSPDHALRRTPETVWHSYANSVAESRY